jgi:hypothetical protein
MDETEGGDIQVMIFDGAGCARPIKNHYKFRTTKQKSRGVVLELAIQSMNFSSFMLLRIA